MQKQQETFISSEEGVSCNEVCYKFNEFSGKILGTVVSIVGNRCSGKTTLLFDLMENIVSENQIDKLIIVTYNGANNDFIEPFKVYGPQDFNQIYDYIIDAKYRHIKKLLVIDHNNHINYIKQLVDLCSNNTIHNLTLILTFQSVQQISKEIKLAIDYFFITKLINNDMKSIFDTYCSSFTSFLLFKKCIEKCADKYISHVINTNNISMSWYKYNIIDKTKLSQIDMAIDLAPKDDKITQKKKIINEINLIRNKLDEIVEKLDVLIN